MEEECDKKFKNAIAKTFCETVYHPKISEWHDTRTSSNVFSFFLSDMSTAFGEWHQYDDFVQPGKFGQLADDAVIYVEHRESLRHKCKQLMDYSKKKFQILNIKKTKDIIWLPTAW